jgi:hypothetical protein
MKTTIDSFAALVERDYGSRIAQGFASQFPGTLTEVSFREAMTTLHRVLACPKMPRPALGATNSDSQDFVLEIKD